MTGAAPDWPAWCERTPASARPKDLGFRPQRMVSWLAPRPLLRTGVRTALSDVFGAYADKRETHAALDDPSVQLEDSFLYRYADRDGKPTSPDGLWFDYAADVGDGFDPTYTVAALLGQETLRPEPPREAPLPPAAPPAPSGSVPASAASGPSAPAPPPALPRGRFLVLGGDQVYPYASRRQYREHFVKPYTAALPGVEGEAPDLYAIPGNHDWYDGLTSFSRLFFQDRSIGAWRTRQRRSYFALRLPGDWWLWGIDIQLESDIDRPQLAYFARVAAQVQPGQRVLLCTATPSWVKEDGYRNLAFFLEKLVLDRGAEPAVLVSGDTHHYFRYEGRGGARQRITAGGGGAYLAATHGKPEELKLKERGRTETYVARARYPSARDSRRRRWGALAFPARNFLFCLVLGGLFLACALVLQNASMDGPTQPLFGTLVGLTPAQAFGAVFDVVAHSLESLFFLSLLLLGSFALMETQHAWKRLLVGSVLGAANLALFVLVLWGAVGLNASFLPALPVGNGVELALFSLALVVELVVGGGVLAGLLMGLHLALTNLPPLRMNANLLFVSQRIPDRKNFLRIHVDAQGALTIHPIGVHRVPRRWWFNRNARDGARWFEPAKGTLRAHLIEAPIRLPPARAPAVVALPAKEAQQAEASAVVQLRKVKP